MSKQNSKIKEERLQDTLFLLELSVERSDDNSIKEIMKEHINKIKLNINDQEKLIIAMTALENEPTIENYLLSPLKFPSEIDCDDLLTNWVLQCRKATIQE